MFVIFEMRMSPKSGVKVRFYFGICYMLIREHKLILDKLVPVSWAKPLFVRLLFVDGRFIKVIFL